MKERLNKRCKRNVTTNAYIDCRFIIGSAADVQRLWSEGKHILTDERNQTSPKMFGAILFMRKKETFQDNQLVYQAIHMVPSDKVEKRLNEHVF